MSKALTAQQAGALFVVIADNDIGSTTLRIEMVHDETGRPVEIPALLIAGKDGWVLCSRNRQHLCNLSIVCRLFCHQFVFDTNL